MKIVLLAVLAVVARAAPADESEGASDVGFRFADLSGCGALRDCPACTSDPTCMWSGSGCTRSATGVQQEQQWCAPEPIPDVTIKKECEYIDDCTGCTETAGCIFYRGQCMYSQGTGCIDDPANCINYAWQCPASNPFGGIFGSFPTSYDRPSAVNVFGGGQFYNPYAPATNNNQYFGSSRPNYNPFQSVNPFARPSVNYGRPAVNYGRPAVNYGRPAVNYGRPAVNYGRPAVNYGRPAVNYGRGRPAVNYGRGRPAANYGRTPVVFG